MKKWYVMTFVTLLLCVVCTVVSLVILPDIIPAHFGLTGQVDRYGSKFELLICPGIAVLADAGFLWCARKEKTKEKDLLIATVIMNVILLAIEAWQFVCGLRGEDMIDSEATWAVRILCIGFGVLLFVWGLYMPRTQFDSLFGIQTETSRESEELWNKTQYAGGMSLMGFSCFMILLDVVLPVKYSLFSTVGILILWAILAYTYPLRVKKKLNK